MFSMLLLVGFVLNSLQLLLAAGPTGPTTVILDSATVTGTTNGISTKFLGIPFAKPPVGDLRFRLPQPIPPYTQSFTARTYGPSCPQQATSLPIVQGLAAEAADYIFNSVYGKVFPDDEDCLTVNVVKPATATTTSKLPVLVWIFGGGFEIGSTSAYDGSTVVARSIAMGQPVVYVSMNYRLTGFGFLASKEVKDAAVGNLGLHDQREALRWVQRYISQFGGDPSKVTIWGESAGAISVALHMLVYDGKTEGLFRAGFMQSGAPLAVEDITHGQKYYDDIVAQTGCSTSADTLQCLRTVPYAKLKAAINKSPGMFDYQALSLAWQPRADGVFLTDAPHKLVQQGKVANISYITGNCDDEGTLFSFSTVNVTTEAQVKDYYKNTFLKGISDARVDGLLQAYPADITAGSPFDTGIRNALTPQFKRIAAIQGDVVFQAPRRWLLDHTADGKKGVWVFLSKRGKALPILGSVHTSDLANSYGGGEMQDYLIRFANTLNPNSPLSFQWPKYDTSGRKILTFLDGLIPLAISEDTYRKAAMDSVTNVPLGNPV